jgi:CRISPR-associated protein Cas2
MAYYIAVYDVESKRCGKMLKLFRRYMTWVQNSVFEGELTEAQYRALKGAAEKLMQQETDMLILYQMADERYVRRELVGMEKGTTSRFI